MSRYTAETVLPGLRIVSENPSVQHIILNGKDRFAKLDEETGMVDIYTATVKVKKVKSTTQAELVQMASIREAMPTVDGKALIQIEGDKVYVNPLIYTLDKETEALRNIYKIVSYVKQHMTLHNKMHMDLLFYKMEVRTSANISGLVYDVLNTHEFADLDIDPKFITAK